MTDGPARQRRTDGTGTCFLPLPIDPSADGGTTPTCALAIVDGVVSTGMARMLIDFEGLPQPGYPAAILLDRPPAAAVYGGVLQLGFPATDPMTNTVLPNTLLGVEMWTTGTTSTFVYTTPSGSIRESLWGAGGLPNATGQFTFQFLFLMPAPQCPPPLTPGIDWAASPALMVGY